jgi:hypothetical protein
MVKVKKCIVCKKPMCVKRKGNKHPKCRHVKPAKH